MIKDCMNKITLYTIATLLLAITTVGSSAQDATDTRQLQEVVVLGGKQKTLSNRGARILGTISVLTPDKVGYEVGSSLSVKHPFEVQEIEFDIISNNIKDVELQVAIYRDSTKILSQPILVNIPEGKRQTIVATPTERTLLVPGDYIVAITFAHCDEATQQQWTNSDQWDGQIRYQMMKQSIRFPLYLKAGHIRNSTCDTFEKCPMNIGLKAKGTVIRSVTNIQRRIFEC